MNIKVMVSFLVLAGVVVSLANAQSQSMSLPRADGRWEHITDSVQVDKKTLRSINVKSGENKGRRWTDAWIRYVTDDGLLLLANLGGFCDEKEFQMTKKVTTDLNGIEKKWDGYEAISVHPDGGWEPVVDGLCQRVKQWWKVW